MLKPLLVPVVFLLLPGLAVAEDEINVTPRITSVDLFKNGIAVVHAVIPVEKPGVLVWREVPTPLHGTFWVENEGEISVRTTRRNVPTDPQQDRTQGNLQTDLAGRTVEVRMEPGVGAAPQAYQGTVWDVPQRAERKTWNTDYLRTSTPPWGRGLSSDGAPAPSSFLILEEEDGKRQYLSQRTIQSVKVTGGATAKPRMIEIPVMLFDARKLPAGGTVSISYLTRGMTWAPSYRLDLSDSGKLSIRQSAVIRNELMDLEDVQVRLISGFPNIEFSQVASPLAPDGTLAAFFEQLGQGSAKSGGAVQTQLIAYNSAAPSAAPPASDPGSEHAGDDLHAESLGARTLSNGDSLSVVVGSGSASYRRVAEWTVADGRDRYGRYDSTRRRDGEENDDEVVWDSVRFANPLPFPMTTAPATMVEKGLFRGQSLVKWTGQGQQAGIRITKALSIGTQYSENEEENQRENLSIGGSNYRRSKVKATLTLRNSRDKAAAMLITKQFSGEMIEASDKPQSRLRTEGVGSVNPRRELAWNLDLAPGEEKIITFRYSVLVRE